MGFTNIIGPWVGSKFRRPRPKKMTISSNSTPNRPFRLISTLKKREANRAEAIMSILSFKPARSNCCVNM